ncbi:AarF/ABC1/UbiB kinase family protein [Sphingomonas sp. So64.6b]|uniref:ABC1 kinase family protein n=1 Tax=Sphingomonas sp. So64.6b TaxID=2997354 RepID=UPI0015FFFE89|nr:AarF/UbiB family protein [Sphingomonas sp. So64.6b]QNA83988.1 AarF/ABC1/UbiB kinase family protein [Sphingomonas sp. So64.6b]
MFESIIVVARDRQRLADISSVATRFGLGALLARLGLERPAPQPDGEPGQAQPLPERCRMALEALGPTFVKLGQILATRADLLPPDWIAAFEQLHSAAPVLPFEQLRAAVEEALGEPPETAFASFDQEPLAAASMAQVHRATLSDGHAIILKIRRPGIRPMIEADLRLIAHLAKLAEGASADIARLRPRDLLQQLTEAVLEELDFSNEARNAERFASDFAGNDRVVIPAIHWEWTSETLLAMDYVAGTPPTDAARLEAAGIDPQRIAALGAEIILDMVLVNGRFHGDPHPGNLLCLPGDRIALLDFGMMGHVSPRRREEMTGFVQSLVAGDPARLGEVLTAWTEGGGVPPARIAAAADRLIARHGQGRLVLARVVADFMALMREERLSMPPDLVLIFKALVTIDGVLMRIDPTFDLAAAATRAWGKVMLSRYSSEALRDRLSGLLLDLAVTGDDLPRLLRATIRKLTAPATDISPDITRLADGASRTGRLICLSVLAAGAMIAAAILLN